MVIPLLLLSRQHGEELDQNTYGVWNRRQNVYASLKVCIFWHGCLISTTTVVGTYRKHRLGRFHNGQKYVIRDMKMGGEVSSFSASMIKLIWGSTQILQLLLKPCPQVDAMYWFRFLLLCSSSPSPQKFVFADDKSKPKPPIPRTNLLTQALYMGHNGSSFGYHCIAVTVCIFVFQVFSAYPQGKKRCN